MIASKRDSSNIYDGCLNYLREEITSKLPKSQSWYDNKDIKYIIGTRTMHNILNTPWDNPPAYFEIFFGKKFIFPTLYILQGRTYSSAYLLKGWNFFGMNAHNQWVLLSSFSGNLFTQNEIKTFPLSVNESYNGFKIQMTEPDTNNAWALCLGQIEVFGDIYSHHFVRGSYLKELTCKRKKGSVMKLFMFICVCSF